MLRHLHITNFAILSDVTIDLEPGFNVFTGETGVGKSLVVDAVSLLRGARASADIPRTGTDEAVVEAVFEAPADLRGLVVAVLDEAGLPGIGEKQVVVRRVVSRVGRSRVHINGGLSTNGVLAKLGALLVDLSGQHEHQGLVDVARHLPILDQFGVDQTLVAKAESAYRCLRDVAARLRRLDDPARAQREDFVNFQLQEIEALQLVRGEDSDLEAERAKLKSASDLTAAVQGGESVLYSQEGAVAEKLSSVASDLSALVDVDPALQVPLGQLEEARALVEDAAFSLARYNEGISSDPGRLEAIEERLDRIQRVFRKHGATTEDVLAHSDELQTELDDLQAQQSHRAELAGQLDQARDTCKKSAAALSKARKIAAKRLAKDAAKALDELGMSGARIDVLVEPRAAHRGEGDSDVTIDGKRLGPRGWDRVELLLSANKGEAARPLAKIASGGELSRIMLALKLSLQQADHVATHVFDEVDAGIGGGIAEVVGRQIERVAQERQVLCVTHLPQIAALAKAHFRLEKYETGGRVETRVEHLSPSARREEIARMLGGVKITSRTRAHAGEMLRSARS